MTQTQHVQTLIEDLNTYDLDARLEAQRNLVAVGTAAIPALVQAVQTEGGRAPYLAVKTLAEIAAETPDPRVLPTLIEALRHQNIIVRQTAAQALGDLGDHTAVDALINALDEGSMTVKVWIVQSLGALGDARAIEPLLSALEQVESEVLCYTIIEALGNLNATRAIPAIRTLRFHSSHHVRSRVKEALHKLMD